MAPFHIRLAKESFKFSSTHFTLFSSTSAERLHGHNYQVSVECGLSALGAFGMGFEFNSLKPLIKDLCNQWDERVLIAKRSPFLKITDSKVASEPHWEVGFQNRAYRLPHTDVVMLETENITSEELARLFGQALATAWKNATARDADLANRVETLTVTIEETRGQNASFRIEKPLTSAKLEAR